MNDQASSDDRVKIVGKPESVPVYNCHVIISRLDNGKIHGQVANLEGIEFEAATERELLQKIVKQFKGTIEKHIEAKQEPPWVEASPSLAKDQVERMIAVHL